MSFWNKLFGGSSPDNRPVSVQSVEFEGFTIQPTPMPEGGQFRLCATISKTINSEERQHKLIRADLFPTVDACADYAIVKAKQVIAEQGDRMFG